MTNIGIVASYFVLWALVLCLSATVYVLARHVGMLHIRIGNTSARATNEGPDIGVRLPEVATTTLDGQPFIIGGSKRHHTLLVFISPGCFNCSVLVPAFKSIMRNERYVDLVLIGRGDDASNRAYLAQHHLSGLIAICSTDLHLLYGIVGTPYAVLLDSAGAVVTKGIVNTAVHLESILNAIDVGHPTAESRALAEGRAIGNV